MPERNTLFFREKTHDTPVWVYCFIPIWFNMFLKEKGSLSEWALYGLRIREPKLRNLLRLRNNRVSRIELEMSGHEIMQTYKACIIGFAGNQFCD
jgi:hypothetical protein